MNTEETLKQAAQFTLDGKRQEAVKLLENALQTTEQSKIELILKALAKAKIELFDSNYTHTSKLSTEEVEKLRVSNKLEEGDILHVKVFANEKHIVHAYFKPASFSVFARAMGLFESGKTLEAGEVLLVNTQIAGNKDWEQNDKLRIAFCIELKNKIPFLSGITEKL